MCLKNFRPRIVFTLCYGFEAVRQVGYARDALFKAVCGIGQSVNEGGDCRRINCGSHSVRCGQCFVHQSHVFCEIGAEQTELSGVGLVEGALCVRFLGDWQLLFLYLLIFFSQDRSRLPQTVGPGLKYGNHGAKLAVEASGEQALFLLLPLLMGFSISFRLMVLRGDESEEAGHDAEEGAHAARHIPNLLAEPDPRPALRRWRPVGGKHNPKQDDGDPYPCGQGYRFIFSHTHNYGELGCR